MRVTLAGTLVRTTFACCTFVTDKIHTYEYSFLKMLDSSLHVHIDTEDSSNGLCAETTVKAIVAHLLRTCIANSSNKPYLREDALLVLRVKIDAIAQVFQTEQA